LINGNTQGIRKSILDQMELMYEADMETLRHMFISPELVESLADFTRQTNREIAIYIARDGMVMDITVGQHDRVGLSELRVRRGAKRLTGIRCIHTHPGGSPILSAVDENALKRMRFDAMAAIGVGEDSVTGIGISMLNELRSDGEYKTQFFGPYRIESIPHQFLMQEILVNAQNIADSANVLVSMEKPEERAILIGIDSEEALDELERLADTAGAKVLSKQLQLRPKQDAATYIGSGKASELSLLCRSLEANLVIADDELTGAQIRNLEEQLGCKVIDRTALILDIFAGRAATHEGKLQVELAQYKYRLPRLIGAGQALSRLGGGIGTRGPGESKLETDRRAIRRRITELEHQVEKLKQNRNIRRSARQRSGLPVASIVGYTNAGKSTLLNLLSGSSVDAEDKLFATLDPVTRKLSFADGGEMLITDTVGFVSKLPHDLVDAFRSTLEEAMFADILIHVVDASSPQMMMQYSVAEEVLRSLEKEQKQRIIVLNKMDKLDKPVYINAPGTRVVEISALTGRGVDELMRVLSEVALGGGKEVELLLPYSQTALSAYLHNNAKVNSEEYTEEGIRMQVKISAALYPKVQQYDLAHKNIN